MEGVAHDCIQPVLALTHPNPSFKNGGKRITLNSFKRPVFQKSHPHPLPHTIFYLCAEDGDGSKATGNTIGFNGRYPRNGVYACANRFEKTTRLLS